VSAAAFALFLLLAPEDPSPEELWARLIDPSIPVAERVREAEKANDILTPEYIPRVAAFKVAIDEGHGRGRGDMRVILEHVEIPTRDADPYALVGELPCGTHSEGLGILETLRRFPMNAETYGVVRNFVTPRSDEFIPRGLPEWWTFAGRDDWHAAQAFIVELSPPHETDGRRMVTEMISTISQMMLDLERMLARIDPFPATAFLALADRIAHDSGDECTLVADATRLVQVIDDPPFGEGPLQSAQECHAKLVHFRLWLADHRGELEAVASKDAAAVEDARKRMQRVTLCRP
jgi:hypothetical protein